MHVLRMGMLCGLAAAIGCGATSTRIISSWAAPDAQPTRFDNVLVVFMSSSESIRRTAENTLVEYIGADRAVPSYTLVSQDEVRDTDAARTRLEAAGFDGAVVMRVIGSSQALTYEPGIAYPPRYGRFWAYYGYGWPSVYDPGYLQTATVVNVETNVYSVANDMLIWGGLSESYDPTDVEESITAIARSISAELRREGLVAVE